MRRTKIVTDSAADIRSMEQVTFESVPMKILSDEREFVDDAALDVVEMADYFANHKGKSRSSCPNVADWIKAFGDAEDVFCITITSNLSGSYNAACMAKQIYEADHPDRHVFVLDTLTAGPEMKLIAEQIRELILQGASFEQICAQAKVYLKTTGLLFILKSMKNLANNGRVSPFVAKMAGLVGIHVVGKASDRGDLEPLHKCRGEARALKNILVQLAEHGFRSGRVRIAHCDNPAAAEQLKQSILLQFPGAQTEIYACGGLCSFYAEKGGLLIGYERG